MRRTLLAIFLLVTGGALAGDFNYGAYRSAWLSDATATFELDPASDYLIDASMKKFHTVATWTGKHRPIGDDRRRFIEGWADALHVPPETAALFGHEVEMRQRSETFWMPIQTGLLPALEREVPAGAETHLYLLLAGAHDQAPVFLVNEFDLVEDADRLGPAQVD